MEPVRVLLVTKGHAFDHDAFLAMFEGMDELDVTMVEQPAAQVILRPENVGDYGAVLFYDMSGIPGIGLMHDGAGDTGIPPDDYRRSIEALIDGGTGIVMLNHGTVSWPLWPLWRSISGSSFMLTEGELNGQRVPGSGYRGGHGPYPNPTISLTPVDPSHPVAAGLAPPEEQAAWSHPEGSNVVVWANAAGNSPVVAADIGDSPEAFGNADFRRLLRNALQWVASPEARQWAANR
jgi:hypothetical protein